MKLAARLIFSLGLALAAWGAGEVYVIGCALRGEATGLSYAKDSTMVQPLSRQLQAALKLLAAGAALAGAGHKVEKP